MFSGLDSPLHLLLLLLIVLLVFGAKRLPEVGRSLGSGIREFRHAVSGEEKPPAVGEQQQVDPARAQEGPKPA
jgi:sec-independent protein translocase protein TatA